MHLLVAALDQLESGACQGALDALAAVRSRGHAAFAAMLAGATASATARRQLAARFPDEVSMSMDRPWIARTQLLGTMLTHIGRHSKGHANPNTGCRYTDIYGAFVA